MVHECVRGRIDRLQLWMVLPGDDVQRVLDAVARRLAGSRIIWWIEPVDAWGGWHEARMDGSWRDLGSGPAAAQQAMPDTSLPPQELVLKAIDGTPEVSAAEAVLARAEAEQRMRRVGTHETQLTVIPQTRKIDGDRRYREWEADVSRGVRWPGKARLDREIGAAGTEAARLMLEDSHHAAARRLLAMWTDWQRAAAALDLHGKQVALWERERHAVDRRVQLGDVAGTGPDRGRRGTGPVPCRGAAGRGRARHRSAGPAQCLSRPAAAARSCTCRPRRRHSMAATTSWVAQILARSHEIGAADALAQQKEAQSRRAHADRLPDPSFGLRVVSDQGGRERAYGLSVSIPMGTAYRSAEAAAAGADAMGAQAELAMVRRDVEQGARQAVAMARARYGIWRRQQEAALATGRVRRKRSVDTRWARSDWPTC